VNAHLSKSPLPKNKWVPIKRGDEIGTAGDTGDMPYCPKPCIHLHFEVATAWPPKGAKVDPYDIYSKRDYYPGGPNFTSCGSNHLWTECPPVPPPTAPPRFAVTDPYYDDIGSILTSMGYEFDELQDSQLADYNFIRNYEAIFINCSGDSTANAPAARESLERYVREGGALYVLDWAFVYLQEAFPGYSHT
jgi:hypothetical protein